MAAYSLDQLAENPFLACWDDPLRFLAACWPQVSLYDKQVDVLRSLLENDETYVPAGNMLGKDFIAGFAIVWFFCSRTPCRIVTTSAKADHLRVLWGEVAHFVRTSSVALPVEMLHETMYQTGADGERVPKSYAISMVASQESIAAFGGHHIASVGDGVPRTMFVADEASSVNDDYYHKANPWANRILVIGNTWPCQNFFRHAICGRPGTPDAGGDIPRGDGRYYRKIIRIRAEDSPNVRLALEQRKRGIQPTNEILIPGIKSYEEYLKNRQMWDAQKQRVSLDAEFPEGAVDMLFPEAWLARAAEVHESLAGRKRIARAMGVDPAEGGDRSCWVIVDELGIIRIVSRLTPDTAVIGSVTMSLMREYGLQPDEVLFDAGGGGKQHADYLRARGCHVRSIGFGETVDPQKRRVSPGMVRQRNREMREQRYAYRNRRAEMYGTIRRLLDPVMDEHGNPTTPGFGIARCCEFPVGGYDPYMELRRQMLPIPLCYDGEGRLYLPPKDKRPDARDSGAMTMRELLGRSPDELDALALACWGMQSRHPRKVLTAT